MMHPNGQPIISVYAFESRPVHQWPPISLYSSILPPMTVEGRFCPAWD